MPAKKSTIPKGSNATGKNCFRASVNTRPESRPGTLSAIKTPTSSKNTAAITIGIIGGDGGQLQESVDIPLTVSSNSTPRIQEGHRIIIHIICELVEKYFTKI